MSTRGKGEREKVERIPDELVDAFFDRELDEGSREKFFTMLRTDLHKCAKVARTQRIISALREPVESPDLTDSIMTEVGRRRGFLPERLRNMVKAGRLAAAACILVVFLGVALLHRYAPDTVSVVERPAPVSRVLSSGAQDASSGMQQISGAVGEVRAKFAEPAAELGRLFAAEDLPEIECGEELRAARVYIVGGLTPDGVDSAPVLGGDSLALYGGSGTDAPFMVPSVVYLDSASTRFVLPSTALGAGVGGGGGLAGLPGWVGAWRDNIFLLQPEPEEAPLDGSE